MGHPIPRAPKCRRRVPLPVRDAHSLGGGKGRGRKGEDPRSPSSSSSSFPSPFPIPSSWQQERKAERSTPKLPPVPPALVPPTWLGAKSPKPRVQGEIENRATHHPCKLFFPQLLIFKRGSSTPHCPGAWPLAEGTEGGGGGRAAARGWMKRSQSRACFLFFFSPPSNSKREITARGADTPSYWLVKKKFSEADFHQKPLFSVEGRIKPTRVSACCQSCAALRRASRGGRAAEQGAAGTNPRFWEEPSQGEDWSGPGSKEGPLGRVKAQCRVAS